MALPNPRAGIVLLEPEARFAAAYENLLARLADLDVQRAAVDQAVTELLREHDRLVHRSEGKALLLTVKDAAVQLACSIDTVYRLIASGAFPCFKLGGSTRISLAELERYVSEGGGR